MTMTRQKQPNQETVNRTSDQQFDKKLRAACTKLETLVAAYASQAPKVAHGAFVNLPPRPLREIQAAIHGIKMGTIGLKSGMATIIQSAQRMGDQHPLLIAAHKLNGILTQVNHRSAQIASSDLSPTHTQVVLHQKTSTPKLSLKISSALIRMLLASARDPQKSLTAAPQDTTSRANDQLIPYEFSQAAFVSQQAARLNTQHPPINATTSEDDCFVILNNTSVIDDDYDIVNDSDPDTDDKADFTSIKRFGN